jgi:hypothetical protein
MFYRGLFSARSISLGLCFHSLDFFGLAILILFVFSSARYQKIGWLLYIASIVLALIAVLTGLRGAKRSLYAFREGVVIGVILIIVEFILAFVYLLIAG